MTKIKICGIRRHEDIEIINKYLPDYAGFVFAKSKRQVLKEHAAVLISEMNKGIKSVGVFVNSTEDEIIQAVKICRLDVIQLHGDENGEYIEALQKRLNRVEMSHSPMIWKAMRICNSPQKCRIPQERTVPKIPLLLDAFESGNYGGTGRTFDWVIAAEIGKTHDIILAGGLNAQNVKDAIRIVKPLVVDVSSGVETDGFKDGRKITEFIDTVRSMED